MGQVRIEPGDIVFGDLDGVCIVPHAAAEEVFTLALEKASKENLVRNGLLDGLSAAESFARYGVM
jgi:4-hydroxy-4-methyl-2-oxoglutarate aldolase